MHVITRHWPTPSTRLRQPALRLAASAPIVGWRGFADWLARRVGERTERGDRDDEGDPTDRARSVDQSPSVDRSPSVDQSRPTDRSGHPRGGALGQVILLIVAWCAYSAARSLAGDDVAKAVHRGRLIQQWDQWLGFGFTHDLNHWVTAHGLFAVPMVFEYATLHYVVTPLVLVWLWRWHSESYRPALYALLAMSAAGLLVYIVFPVAPPRLLPGAGWIDTMSHWSYLGWWGGAASAPAGFANFTDQFAAMPSLHVGWALWCAFAWYRAGGKVIGRIGWLYPALVAVTVIATANHYVLDVVAGAALATLTCLVIPRLLARRAASSSRVVVARSTPAVDLALDRHVMIDLREPAVVEGRPLP